MECQSDLLERYVKDILQINHAAPSMEDDERYLVFTQNFVTRYAMDARGLPSTECISHVAHAHVAFSGCREIMVLLLTLFQYCPVAVQDETLADISASLESPGQTEYGTNVIVCSVFEKMLRSFISCFTTEEGKDDVADDAFAASISTLLRLKQKIDLVFQWIASAVGVPSVDSPEFLALSAESAATCKCTPVGVVNTMWQQWRAALLTLDFALRVVIPLGSSPNPCMKLWKLMSDPALNGNPVQGRGTLEMIAANVLVFVDHDASITIAVKLQYLLGFLEGFITKHCLSTVPDEQMAIFLFRISSEVGSQFWEEAMGEPLRKCLIEQPNSAMHGAADVSPKGVHGPSREELDVLDSWLLVDDELLEGGGGALGLLEPEPEVAPPPQPAAPVQASGKKPKEGFMARRKQKQLDKVWVQDFHARTLRPCDCPLTGVPCFAPSDTLRKLR